MFDLMLGVSVLVNKTWVIRFAVEFPVSEIISELYFSDVSIELLPIHIMILEFAKLKIHVELLVLAIFPLKLYVALANVTLITTPKLPEITSEVILDKLSLEFKIMPYERIMSAFPLSL